MPELPEVEVVRRGLSPAVTGARLSAIEVLDERALTRHTAGAADFVSRLEGRTTSGAARRGKFLWLPLADASDAIMVHLGMSGQMLLRAPDAPRERHERIRLMIEHPQHGELAIVFADQRTFGSLAVDALIETRDGKPAWSVELPGTIPSQAAHIGRDLLDPHIDHGAVVEAFTRRRSAVKRVLLDQNIVSGIGNIYADEALWASQIHPETLSSSLMPSELRGLLEEVEGVLHKALAEGGTSFDAQYVNVNGQAGYFSRYLHSYGRTGEPCDRCGTPIKRIAFGNRSSHFCPRCQRKPSHAST